VKRATKDTLAGKRYLDLQRLAKRSGRPTDELIQLYALECFLDRLAHSEFADHFILKGGVLLAALDARRPTRDIDLAARVLENSADTILAVVKKIADTPIDDGVKFESGRATAEVIREDADYSGIRVTLSGVLSRAVLRLHVDVNIGDPIWPEPQQFSLPRLLRGVLAVRGYPLEMVLAEKLVTALQRGTANTRWRDFLDVYVLISRHSIEAGTMRFSMQRVAQHRGIGLIPLGSLLADYPQIAQQRWSTWLRKQRLDAVPTEFSAVLEMVISFADEIITNDALKSWEPSERKWR
jgi:predicted nucleotidyltransferase component of viral defense system